ncbi:MAG: cytochrome P450 [Deltaproteobacteria bacterium]|nr:cytochrome P450 [Deltaproteobacteria bacterium]
MTAPITLGVAPRFYKQWQLARNAVGFCNQLRAEFGDLVLARGFFDFYLVNDPELVGMVLVNKDRIVDRVDARNPIYQRIGNIGRSGLATSAPEHWRQQRRRVAPLFGASAIRGFAETMIASAETWAARWDAKAASGAAFDMKAEMNELSLEVNTRCLFNTELRDDHARLQGWFSTMKRYLEAFPYPLFGAWWFPSPLNLQTKAALRAFDRWALGLIARRRAAPLAPDAIDMITRMLGARDPETGAGMSDEEIVHELLTFLIAGFESTSSALLWTFYQLSQHPDIEARVHAELDDVLGDRALTMEDLPKLAYTRRVIDEVMRQTPAVWFMARTTVTEVDMGGNRIPEGSHLLMSIPTLHNNPAVWPEPARFDPDRFLPEAVAARSPNAYVPFGRGPHACIGSHFSLQELLVMTAALARRFRAVLVDDLDPTDVRAGLSVYPRHGVRMRLERRAAVATRKAS